MTSFSVFYQSYLLAHWWDSKSQGQIYGLPKTTSHTSNNRPQSISAMNSTYIAHFELTSFLTVNDPSLPASAPSPICLQSSFLDSPSLKWNLPIFFYVHLHIEEFLTFMILVNPLKTTCQQLHQCCQLISQTLLPIRPTTAWTSSFRFLVLDGVSGIYPLIVLVSNNDCWLLVLLHRSAALPYQSSLESFFLLILC